MNQTMPPRFLVLVTVVCFVGLILGIAGVSSADSNTTYHAGSMVKASMGIFLAVFVIILLLSVWLYSQLHSVLRKFQTKLFLAIALSVPFLAVRLAYSAISDYGNNSRFSTINGDPTIYLCMSVLEEIVAVGVTMALGVSAVLEGDFVQVKVAEVRESRLPGDV